MLDIRLDLTDLRRFTQGFENVEAQIIEAAGVGLWEGVNLYIVPQAQVMSPVDTGALRDSIHSEWMSPTSVAIKADAPYAIYQEAGFYHVRGGYEIPGRYFLQDAILNGMPDVNRRILANIEMVTVFKKRRN